MVNTLNETVAYMISSDYKDRFKAEYLQLEYRYNKLKKMLEDWDNGRLSFSPTCDRELYTRQINAMTDYFDVLKIRAEIENVDV